MAITVTEKQQKDAQELVNKIMNEVEEEKAMKTNTTNNATVNEEVVEEEVNMKKDVLKNLTDEMVSKTKGLAGQVKVVCDEETGEIKSNLDDKLNSLTDTLAPALSYIDGVLGLTTLRDELRDIIFDYTSNGRSVSSYIKIARKCRKAINEQIELLEIVDDEESFKKTVALRQLIGEDEDGEIVTQSIFSSFAKGVVWLVKKAVRYIKGCPMFSTDPEANVFGAVGAKIADFIGTVFGVAKAVVGIAGTVFKYVLSYTVAGVVKIAATIISVFKGIFDKAKVFIAEKFAKGELDDDSMEEFEDDDYFEDESDPDFSQMMKDANR